MFVCGVWFGGMIRTSRTSCLYLNLQKLKKKHTQPYVYIVYHAYINGRFLDRLLLLIYIYIYVVRFLSPLSPFQQILASLYECFPKVRNVPKIIITCVVKALNTLYNYSRSLQYFQFCTPLNGWTCTHNNPTFVSHISEFQPAPSKMPWSQQNWPMFWASQPSIRPWIQQRATMIYGYSKSPKIVFNVNIIRRFWVN